MLYFSGKLYEDPVFPPIESSLYQYNKLNIKNIKWKRPHVSYTHLKYIGTHRKKMKLTNAQVYSIYMHTNYYNNIK